MNKSTLIDGVAKKTGLSKKSAQKALETILETLEETLINGDSVTLIGFGSFSIVKRSARKAIVPGTDRVVNVPETKAVKFKAGKKLKDGVANS